MHSLLDSCIYALVALLLLGTVVADRTVCGQQTIWTNQGRLIFISNAWNPMDGGFQCLTTNDEYSKFSATSNWPSQSSTTVHSYPHVRFQPSTIPVPVTQLNSLTLAAEWQMSQTSPGMVANVAWDMFADADPATSQLDSEADWEVMIWMGRFGTPYPAPIGKPGCLPNKYTINGVVFDLWCGPSWRPNLTTFSWVAETNMTSFNNDFGLFVRALVDAGKMPSNVYLGKIGFGSEAFRSSSNVTIDVSNYSVTVNGGGIGPVVGAGHKKGFFRA